MVLLRTVSPEQGLVILLPVERETKERDSDQTLISPNYRYSSRAALSLEVVNVRY